MSPSPVPAAGLATRFPVANNGAFGRLAQLVIKRHAYNVDVSRSSRLSPTVKIGCPNVSARLSSDSGTGVDLARQLRHLEQYGDTPIVLLAMKMRILTNTICVASFRCW